MSGYAFVAGCRRCFALVVLTHLISFATVFLGGTFLAFADEPVAEKSGLEKSANGRSKLSEALQQDLPDGRLLRSVGILDSQKFELIPSTYSPVQQSQLIKAITRWENAAVETPGNRLRKAEYVVRIAGDLMTCERGYLDIAADQNGWVTQSLGNVSFAITEPDFTIGNDQSVSGRLVSGSDGTLLARFDSQSLVNNRIPLKWKIRGVSGPRGYSFDIRFPRTLETRFLFCVDDDVTLDADSGVLRSIEGGPDSEDSSDVAQLSRGVAVRWYELDAGGLDSIRVRSVGKQDSLSAEAIIIRRNAVEYNIDASGLFFIQRMELGLPVGVSFPKLGVFGAKLTSVKVNASDASFVQLGNDPDFPVGDDVFLVDYQVIPPPGAIGRNDTRVSLTLMGQADWGDVCSLPLAGIVADADVGIPIVDACLRDEARVTMAPVGKIIDWELPYGWQRQSALGVGGMNVETAFGTSLFAAFESAIQTGSRQAVTKLKVSKEMIVAPKPWSRLRLSKRPVYHFLDLWLRAEVGESGIDCDAIFDLQLNDQVIEPLQFEIQEGWEIGSVSFPLSGRVIETPQIDVRRRLLTVWPEGADIDQTSVDDVAKESFGLRIQISGERKVRSRGSRMAVPATWMVRACDHRSRRTFLSDDFTAAVIPPPDMNWAGDASMMPHRVDGDQLPQDQRRFFDGEGRTTLFFKPRHRQIDVLGLESPSVDFQASLSLQINKRGDEILEQCFVKVSSLGRGLEELVVHTGPAVSRPAFRWMIPGQNGSLSTTLAVSDVELTDIDGKGVYTINVAGLDLASRPLMAYRSYPAKDVSTQLPSIPNAVSGTSQLYIGAGLEIANKSKGVQLVPRTATLVDELSGSLRSMLKRGSHGVNENPDDDPQQADGLHLRYDSVQKPSVDLKVADYEVSINLITHSQTRVVASSRGTDHVETRVLASLSTPLEVCFGPELQLASVTRDGMPMDLSKLSTSPLVLLPRKGKERGNPEVIGLEWNRNQIGFHVVRRCRMPRIGFDAVVLKHEYHLTASADTFAPGSLLSGNSQSAHYRVLEMSPDESTFLIRRNVLLAGGWLLAMVNFIAFWCMMKRSPVLVVFCLAVISVSVLLWWPWRMTIIGWFVVPLIAAAMLVAARWWGFIDNDSLANEIANPGIGLGDENTSSQAVPSTDFSWESMLKGWVIAFAVISPALKGSYVQAQTNLSVLGDTAIGDAVTTKANRSGAAIGSAQNQDAINFDLPANSPVNVLIPMDMDNRRVGEFVYVPESLHQQLFDDQAQSILQSPAYASASYQLKIRESDVSHEGFIGGSLVATLDLEFPSEWGAGSELESSNPLRRCLIPLPFELIEKIQSIGLESTTLRYSAEPKGGIVVVLPKNKTAQIQVALRLKGVREGPWIRFELGVPAVSNSRIEVESEIDLRVLRVGGLTGSLIEESDLRRWSEVLGPTEQLDISFRVDPRADAAAAEDLKPLQRRYWVSAGLTSTTIDCEVDASETFAAGEVFQFVIRDSAMPTLMSPDWRLVETLVYAPRRRRVSVMSVRDSPGPVQLLWKISNEDEWASGSGLSAFRMGRAPDATASVSGGLSGNDSVQIRIPEVIASSLGENAPAWIALRCVDSLSFDPLPSGVIEPLSVDQFLAGWSGYRGRIDRAFVALDDIPSPRLRISTKGGSRIEDSHRLRVSPQRLELSYQADVTPGLDNYEPYLLSIPQGVELVDLYINEIRQRPFSVESGGRRHVMIDLSDRQGEAFSVSAFAIGELSPGEQFSPPVMVLSNSNDSRPTTVQRVAEEVWDSETVQVRASSYTVSRTNDSFFQIVEPFAVDATRSIATLTADSLSEGYLPVATWKANSITPTNADVLPTMFGETEDRQGDDSGSGGRDIGGNIDFWRGNWGGVFRVQKRTDRFNCDQLIKLKRLDRDWQVSCQIHFAGQRVPDYVDIEIPTRWCDSLEISPATAWSRQPSTNALHQIVRVRCDSAKYQGQPLVFTGLLSQKDDGRVSVPTIRVLGSGKRNIYVQVPKRLTSELVQWRRVGVEETKLPQHFVGGQSNSDSAEQYASIAGPSIGGSGLAYRVIRGRWSIDLAPLPELSLQPIATAQDNQVFLADGSFSVMTHWDVSPGSLEKLLVSVPADAECLGAWSGGVTVTAITQDSSSVLLTDEAVGAEGQRQFLEIPLSLSQLPQSVKVLLRFPATRLKRGDYVPRLVGIPVTQAWLAVYEPKAFGDRGEPDLASETSKLRNLSLARSAVESIELAVDIVAERSSDEVVPWVAPWVYRYLQLAAASGRTAQFLKSASEDAGSDPAELLGNSIKQFEDVQWRLLDRRIAVYANRYVPDLQSRFGEIRGLQTTGTDRLGDRSGSSDQLSGGSPGNNLDYRAFLGDDAIFSSARVPGFRLDQVRRLASVARATPLGSAANTDHRLRRMLGNVITIILVIGLLVCLKPLKRFLRPLIVHPAFWLAALGVAGLFVAPSYVALSLILVAISMPWFPSRQKRQLTA